MSVKLIEHNPMLKHPSMTVLDICTNIPGASREELEGACKAAWSESFNHPASVIVDLLVRNSCITESIFVDGEPYDGSLKDLQLDTEIPEDAEVTSQLNIAADGQQILNDYRPDNLLANLLQEKPHYREVFITVLKTCDSDKGCTLPNLEAAINTLDPLKPDAENHTRVYPQYFIDALETAGGITWSDSWHTTAAGKVLLTH